MNEHEGVQITVSHPPTYFTVWTTAEGGFTDKLLQFSAFYRLGRSLGYQYWHSSPVQSQRSSSLAFDFVGLNAHLAEFGAPPFQHFRYLDIRFSLKLIERNKIGTFERLQQYAQASVAHARMTYAEDNLVVRLGLGEHGRRIYSIIHNGCHDVPDELDCLDIYRQARALEPRASQFQTEKTRVLIHMRQGDTGVIETPWHTFISTWCLHKSEYLRELESYDQLCAEHVEVEDFYDFMHAFQSQYADELSLAFCSDGYGATFDHLFSNFDRFNFDDRKLETLREMSQSYDQQKFGRFDCFVDAFRQFGESDENFCDLVNNIVEAEIIVTSTQQSLIVQFLARFYDLQKPKIVLLLHRGGKLPDRQWLDLSERKAVLIPVDVRNYDIGEVCAVVRSKLPDLAPIVSDGKTEAKRNLTRRETSPHKPLDQFQYLNVDDLWIICCHFNAANYKTMPRNYALFEKSLQNSGLKFITVECAFDGPSFSLKPSENVIQVRSNSVLWQKERLLNLAISRLPRQCKKVAWLDADVFFLNNRWAVEASQLLEEYPVVQVFERAAHLSPGRECYTGEKGTLTSFGYVLNEQRERFNQDEYLEHGHTGYGWAIRREVIEKHGFYDRLIVGSADHTTAHAMIGNFCSPCLDRDLGGDPRQIEPFREWAESFHKQIRSKVGYVPGTVVHKWHGSRQNRHHGERHDRLSECGFDPGTDLRLNDQGCWEWNTDKPELHSFLRQYFASRCEDG